MTTDNIRIQKFDPLAISSKYLTCGLPIRMDTYGRCTFGCRYCSPNTRVMMTGPKGQTWKVGDVKKVKKRLERIFDRKEITEGRDRLLDTLISQGVTFHCGGMSDAFQPAEGTYHITRDLVEVCNQYDRHILFSTKSDNIFDVPLNPKLHTFQMSVSNTLKENWIEPNVANIDRRVEFFNELKSQGFKVGIRIQPFIPNVSTMEILEKFAEADHFTLECIKANPQKSETDNRAFVFEELGLNEKDFKQVGLLKLKPEIRAEAYAPFLDWFKSNGKSYSVADSDMRNEGNNVCCCGDKLVNKSSGFDTTAMIKKYGQVWTEADLLKELNGVKDCRADHLCCSNRVKGKRTVEDFATYKFDKKACPSSPKFQWRGE